MPTPTLYSDDLIPLARAMATVGGIDREIAECFGVTERTLNRWKLEHPEFGQALKTGKAPADARVEHSLYRRATGYSYDAEKVFQYEGKPVRVPLVEHVPPDTTACIFWLKNRRSDEWRDKQDVHLSGELKGDSGELALRLASIFSGAITRS